VAVAAACVSNILLTRCSISLYRLSFASGSITSRLSFLLVSSLPFQIRSFSLRPLILHCPYNFFPPIIMYFASTLLASALLVVASGAALTSRSLSGQATFYGGNVAGGTCSFSTFTIPTGLYGTALSDSNWENSSNCGACVAVTLGSTTITAMVCLCYNPLQLAQLI
jgi:hypothetical protein